MNEDIELNQDYLYWNFKFPSLGKVLNSEIELEPGDFKYPGKLIRWVASLKANPPFDKISLDDVKKAYDDNAFTTEQRENFSPIFKFYGEELDEVRVYCALTGENTNFYLMVILSDYYALENELQMILKERSKELIYINSVERIPLYLQMQRNHGNIQYADIERFRIMPFEYFPSFTLFIHHTTLQNFNTSSDIFLDRMGSLRQIDPYGNMYYTNKLDLVTLDILIKRSPKYSQYFQAKKKAMEILNGWLFVYQGLAKAVSSLDDEMTKRVEMSTGLKQVILAQQLKILNSRKPENLLYYINDKVNLLNVMIKMFNHTFKMRYKGDEIDFRLLTDNMFYGDYIKSIESINSGLVNELVRIINLIE